MVVWLYFLKGYGKVWLNSIKEYGNVWLNSIKADLCDITEILFKVALNTITPTFE
jgi:hypothetical protein